MRAGTLANIMGIDVQTFWQVFLCLLTVSKFEEPRKQGNTQKGGFPLVSLTKPQNSTRKKAEVGLPRLAPAQAPRRRPLAEPGLPGPAPAPTARSSPSLQKGESRGPRGFGREH